MSTSATVATGQSMLFKAGWIVLAVAAALMTLNHLWLIFFLNDPPLFVGWTAFNLYSLLVVLIPFRGLERWAWYGSWLLPVGLAIGGFTATDVSLFYYSTAAVCALGMLLTMRDFFAADRGTV